MYKIIEPISYYSEKRKGDMMAYVYDVNEVQNLFSILTSGKRAIDYHFRFDYDVYHQYKTDVICFNFMPISGYIHFEISQNERNL
jgi:hypothetical protein